MKRYGYNQQNTNGFLVDMVIRNTDWLTSFGLLQVGLAKSVAVKTESAAHAIAAVRKEFNLPPQLCDAVAYPAFIC